MRIEGLPLFIDISRLKKDAADEQFTVLLPDFASGIAVYTDLRLAGKIVNHSTLLHVSGLITAKAEFACGRCLEPYQAAIEVGLEVDCKAGVPDNDANLEILWYQGECINIYEPVKQQLILDEPVTQICRPDCRGLCPICGGNLNIGDCGCSRETINPQFAVLKQLLESEKS